MSGSGFVFRVRKYIGEESRRQREKVVGREREREVEGGREIEQESLK